ncbi:porin OmpC [Candidatus Moranella endobia]|uniref:Putative outer membrane protein n=1 Tax=Moranella endobia (strain PCIT) TaxID=903503 RepID=F7XXD3_MOREP|nr:porin OmpC [Candidatus Moranella endobia]AEI74759.1 putative outer membrane protein [Candidatus Moranella endobia PCIT]
MKIQYLSVLMSAIAMVSSARATEVYNKEGNKLDLYGKFNCIRYMSFYANKNGDRSFVRYGFRAETKLSANIISFGTLEQEVGLRHTESIVANNHFSRLGFAGIKFTNVGSIDYGRNYGVLYDVGAWTDIVLVFSGDTTVTDNVITGRANSLLTYRNTNCFGRLDGFNFALQYQGKNDSKVEHKTDLDLQKENGVGYGISVTYDFGKGVSAGAAVTSSNRTMYQRLQKITRNTGKKAQACFFGMKYNADKIYLAALYGKTRNMTSYGKFTGEKYGVAKNAHNIALIAQYKLYFGLRPSLGYLQLRVDSDYSSKRQDIKKHIDVGARYNFSKHMLTFIDYRINLLSNNDFISAAQISTKNIIALGLTYMF